MAVSRAMALSLASTALVGALAACDNRNYNPGIFDAPASGIAGGDETAAPSAEASAPTATASSAPSSDAGPSKGAAKAASGAAAAAAASAPSTASTSASSAPRTLDIPTPVPGDGAKSPSSGQPLVDNGEVVVAPGEELYQKLARDKKFDEFRRRSASFVELSAEMLPLGAKLADGSATAEERAEYFRMEKQADQLFKPLNAYMWNERWTEQDRAAMGWILYGSLQKPR
jgi:hypothetical protein